jgi:TRAP-type C4-dicarboxylate transport system substrate-binding protein
MKRIKLCILILFFIFSFTSAYAGKIKLKMAVIVPERSIWGKKFKEVVKKIKEQTDGNVNLKVYYGGVQGDELKVVQKMRIGQLHGAGFMARGMSKVCPDSLVFAIPMLLHNEKEATSVHKKMQDFFEKQARERGFEIIGWSNQGFTYCFSKDEVNDIDSLRKARPWMLTHDEFGKSFFKSSSIAAVPAQVGDVMTALQSGMIRTVFSPPIGMIVMQWHSRVKYRMDLGIMYSFGAIVISTKQWEKIEPRYQKVIKKVFGETLKDLNVGIDKQNADALKVLSKTLKETKPSEEAIKEFREITLKVEQDMTGKVFSAEAMKLLKKHLKEFREKNNKE